MKLCFDRDKELTKKEHKKCCILSLVLLLFIVIIETILMIILNRENINIVLTIAIVLFVIFTIPFTWFFFYKREFYKTYLKNIDVASKDLLEKEMHLVNISSDFFIKEHLQYYLLSFSLEGKQIDLEVLADKKDEFSINKTYKVFYKGSVLYKYEEKDI